MATEEKSFADLVKQAPAAPAGGTISLVGTLAQSPEEGKFVLNLQDGSSLTLETAVVKGHAVLGASVGQTIVRVDIDAGKVPTISREGNTQPTPWARIAGGVTPFIAATPHQASAATIAVLLEGVSGAGGQLTTAFYVDHKLPGLDLPKPPSTDQPPPPPPGQTIAWLDKNPLHDGKNPRADNTFPSPYPPYHTADF
jgi:hypothetical protein